MKFGEWVSGFSDKYKQYIEELSQTGVDTAQQAFNMATPQYGNGGVVVSREFDGTTDFTIRASGEDAAFIEFGTGVGTVVTRPTVSAEFPIEPGSWSEEHKGPFSQNGYWMYNGIRLEGTPAIGGMQDACNVMQQESPNIARRVFG